MNWVGMQLSRLVLLAGITLAALPAGLAQVAGADCTELNSDCLLAQAREPLVELSRQFDRDEAHFAIAAALAALDRLDEAVAEAEFIDNATTRAEVLAEVANAAARNGNFETAFELAIAAADGRFLSAQIEALESLAARQAAHGDIDGAFETVVAIANPYRRSEAQAGIALAVARTGDIASAIRAASRIGMGYWFTSDQNAHKVASGIVARNGEFDHYWFFEALALIAEIQCASGDIVGAMQTANAIPDLVGRSRAFSRIAAFQAKTGDIEAARETARRIEIAFGDREALVAISIGMAGNGEFEAALDLARAVQDTYGDGSALVGLAELKAGSAAFDQSIEIASEIQGLEHSDAAWASIGQELAGAGLMDRAVDVLSRIPDRNKRFDIVLGIVGALAREAGADPALALAEHYASPRTADELVMTIALALARGGDLVAALDVTDRIDDGMFRTIALAGLAASAG